MNDYSLREIWRIYRRSVIDWQQVSPRATVNDCCTTRQPERHLLTVGLGVPFDEAAQRLARQARAAGWFDVIHVIDGHVDSLQSEALIKELEIIKREYPKGAGLWAWKPALLRRAMEQAPKGAHIYYIDAGCELSPLGMKRFEQLDFLLAQKSVLLFHLPFLEDKWTKPKLLDCFPEARGTNQIQATWLGLRNDKIGEALVKRWDDCCREQNFMWLKDPSVDQQLSAIEHRHDQSVLSCIVKSEFQKITTLPWEDFFAPWMYHPESEVLLAPVHALRTRDGRSVLDPLIKLSTLEGCMRANIGRLTKAQKLCRAAHWFRHLLRDEAIILIDFYKRRRKIFKLKRDLLSSKI